jgi:hypothetical protein
MDRAQSFDAEAVEAALRRLPVIELRGLFRRSSNYTFLVELCDEADGSPARSDGEAQSPLSLGGASPPPATGQSPAAQPPLTAVYKPAQGESPLWDFPAGTLYRREVASYLLAKYLGWPRVPPTVIRDDAPHGVGAVQLFIEAQPNRHYLMSKGEPADLWIEVALFDVLTNNADRKSGHCITDGQGVIWMIDHGLTFHAEPKLRTVIWDFAGRRVPRRLRPDLERTAESLTAGALADLRALISRRELVMLRRRLDAMLHPGWELPYPTSAWSVPWPAV